MIIKGHKIHDLIHFLQYLKTNHGDKIAIINGKPVECEPLYIQLKSKEIPEEEIVKEGDVPPFYFYVTGPVIPGNKKYKPYYKVYFKMK